MNPPTTAEAREIDKMLARLRRSHAWLVEGDHTVKDGCKATDFKLAADEIERLRTELAKCGKENCMGRRVEGVTQWVTVQARDAAIDAARAQHAQGKGKM